MKKLAALILAASFIVPCMTPAPASAAPEYTFSLSLMFPPIHNRWKNAIKPWVEEIEKRSQGRIKIEPYFAEALCKAADSYEAVKTGVADMAEFCYDMAPGQFPFHERAFTLVSPDRSLDNTGEWMNEMEKRFPSILKEVSGVKMLFSHAVNVGMLVGTKAPITSLEDFKNRKINVDGDAQASGKVASLGASVVSIPTSDLFMALQQGVVDGTTCDFEILVSRRFGEVVKHMTLLNTAASAFTMIMNEDVYNDLPEDLRKVIDEVSLEYGTKAFNKFWAEGQYTALEKWAKDYGGTVHILSADDYKKANELMQPVMQQWIDVVNKAGLPGEELEKAFRELEAKYTKPWAESRAASYVKK
ncbi:MAG: TRAP transporter substrate-binding protein [Mailhella sp.]